MPPTIKTDLDKCQEIKTDAAKEFKQGNHDKATEKYYQILNVLRENSSLKQHDQGKLMESTTRLNIALCKFNMKDYDTAIDQCERVLDADSKNAKACFRLA